MYTFHPTCQPIQPMRSICITTFSQPHHARFPFVLLFSVYLLFVRKSSYVVDVNTLYLLLFSTGIINMHVWIWVSEWLLYCTKHTTGTLYGSKLDNFEHLVDSYMPSVSVTFFSLSALVRLSWSSIAFCCYFWHSSGFLGFVAGLFCSVFIFCWLTDFT